MEWGDYYYNRTFDKLLTFTIYLDNPDDITENPLSEIRHAIWTKLSSYIIQRIPKSLVEYQGKSLDARWRTPFMCSPEGINVENSAKPPEGILYVMIWDSSEIISGGTSWKCILERSFSVYLLVKIERASSWAIFRQIAGKISIRAEADARKAECQKVEI